MKIFLEQEPRKWNFQYKIYDENRNVLIDQIEANRILFFWKLRKIKFNHKKVSYVLKQENLKQKILSQFIFVFRLMPPFWIYKDGCKVGCIKKTYKRELPNYICEVENNSFELYIHKGNKYTINLSGTEIAEINRNAWKKFDSDHYTIETEAKNFLYEICFLVLVVDLQNHANDRGYRYENNYSYTFVIKK